MKDCIFCKLANGEIPTNIVYQDDIVCVFMDANPKANGHMLIVPKKHFTDFTEITPEVISHIHEVAQKMKELIYSKLNPSGLMLVNNYGSLQEVKHYHLHIIPAYNTNEEIVDASITYNKLMEK